MLTDEAKIQVRAGRGGNGSASFRREKYIPKGGPDGGDGGDGDDIILFCDDNTHTLSNYASQKVFEAKNGEDGRKKRQHGKNGLDLILKVPIGTVVHRISQWGGQEKMHDFTIANDQIIIAKGGKGGLGNVHFATSTHQAPRETTLGEPGEALDLRLELKLIADVGLVGLPNAGKSTLLSVLSNAKPKIADYPFTTLEPNLGAVDIFDKKIVVADIPGLIEGASEGKGLGDKFLRHIERTKILVHLISVTNTDIKKDYLDIRKELEAWSTQLLEKQEIIVLTKIDTLDKAEITKLSKKLAKELKKPVLAISAVSGTGIKELISELAKYI